MAATLNDLIRCIDFQSYLGQTVLNVYYYHFDVITGAGDGYLEDMDTQFRNAVMQPVLEVQSQLVTHTHTEWRNLSNNTDIFDNDTTEVGVLTASAGIQSFVSLGFMLRRSSLVTRNGYKRFVGLTEADVSNNDWVGGDTRLDNISAGLVAPLVDGLIQLGHPIIVKRPIAVPAGSYTFSEIADAPFRSVGTQNSRKPGRGI